MRAVRHLMSRRIRIAIDRNHLDAETLQGLARQQKLDKLSRIRAVSGEINAAIVRIRDREALLRETCRIASEHGKFELVGERGG